MEGGVAAKDRWREGIGPWVLGMQACDCVHVRPTANALWSTRIRDVCSPPPPLPAAPRPSHLHVSPRAASLHKRGDGSTLQHPLVKREHRRGPVGACAYGMVRLETPCAGARSPKYAAVL